VQLSSVEVCLTRQ